MKDLERNIRMTQERLYRGYADTIRLQLAAAKESRSEYVVHFDFGRWPVQAKLRVYTDFFCSCDLKKWFEENVQSDDTTIMFIFQSPFFNGNPDTPNLVMTAWE